MTLTTTPENDNDIILKLMAKPLDTMTAPQSRLCSLFVFIDQLITKYEMAPHHKEKQLKMIDTLLQSGPRMHVAIHSPREEQVQQFMQKMVDAAEGVESEPATHQPIIQTLAKRFKDAYNAFLGLIKSKIASIDLANVSKLWNFLDAENEIRYFAMTFVNTLVNFSYLFYQETIGRLLKLNTNQVEGRLHQAQCLCAKAIM